MGGSSSNDSVGGSSSASSNRTSSNSSSSDKGESFSNAMSNAERPDRAPATSSSDSNNSDTGDGSRSPNDDGGSHSLSNAERPDRAPAAPSSGAGTSDPNDRPTSPNDNDSGQSERAAGPPGIAAAPSSTTPTETSTSPTDSNQDDGRENERGFFDGIADVFSAPPTDASGNPRSTSPVSDRLNNTQSYSLDDLRNVFDGEAAVTPEQREALANGAAVMDGVIMEASYPGQATPESLSPLQGAVALADAELAVSMEVYQRETTTKIGDIDDRIATIDQQLNENVVQDPAERLHLGAERTQLTVERQELERTITSPETIERTLRDGNEKIGLSAETLEKVVTGRDELAKQIIEKRDELLTAPVNHPNTLALRDDLLNLQDDYRNMTDLGIAYQDLIDQEQKLEAGETIYVSKETSRIAEELLAKAVTFTLAPPSLKPLQLMGRTSRAAQTELIPEGELTIKKRDDGVYEVMVPELRSPNDQYSSKLSHYEIREDGSVTLTKQVFDGGSLSGRPFTLDRPRPVDDLNLGELTNGTVSFSEGSIRIAPEVREHVETILTGGAETR